MNLTKIDAITLFVADARVAAAFYQRAFGINPVFEDESSAAFAFEGAVVNLLDRRAAPELVGSDRVAVANAGSSFQITLEVDDVDQAAAELAERGVDLLSGPMDRPWGIRTASFADADGHIWEIAAKIGG